MSYLSVSNASGNDGCNFSNVNSDKKSLISDHVLFAAKLHSYSDIPRARATCIIADANKLCQKIVSQCQLNVMQCLNSSSNITQIKKEINDLFLDLSSSLTKTNTEYRCIDEFEQQNTYIAPQEYLIGEREEFVTKNKIRIIEKVRVTAQFIPIRFVLKIFFEIPSVLDETLRHMNLLLNNKLIISNFVQCSLWKKLSSQFENKIVLPLFMFFDDYENNNPLGSHKGISQCGAVYLSIPCLPPSLVSKVNNIFLFILFNTLDRKVFHNHIVFSKVIDELNFLEKTGINVSIGGKDTKIYFKLALITGDNLGLHAIFGLIESFKNHACCRFCKISKKKFNSVFEEDVSLLRDEENYETDLLINDEKKTGIVKPCTFHTLPDFHITKNRSVDFMHDALEGICQYDLGNILHAFISNPNKKSRFFTLEQLNHLVRAFDYGSTTNKPPEILDYHIARKILSMTASEMLAFIRHLPLVIGHLVPEDNRIWKLLLKLQHLIELLKSERFHVDSFQLLNNSISEYLELLVKLFPGCLKPKHHFLIHYPRVFLENGPFWHYSSMRFESKHQEAKKTSHASISRVNVCRTIAIKHQLQLNYRLLSEASNVFSQWTYDPKKIQICLTDNLLHILEFRSILPLNLINKTHLHTVKNIFFEGNNIFKGCIIMIPGEDEPSFQIVEHVIVEEKFSKINLVVKKLEDIFFDNHLNSYEVLTEDFIWKILSEDDLSSCVMTHINHSHDGRNIIVKKWI